MRVHIIENGIVINTIEVESVEFAQCLFGNFICMVDENATVGFEYSENKLIKPQVSKDEQKKALVDEINAIEREDGCNRKVRELLLKLEDNSDFSYKRLKEIDNEIVQLRYKLQEIGNQ